ncbi:MAG: S8 family peptidase [Gemmatimonadota bacterium]|nr:S8 family peptidase [Gemmatimonadota bacterium]
MPSHDAASTPRCYNGHGGGRDFPLQDGPEHSGFIILRLSPHIVPQGDQDLESVAKRYELRGLLEVLDAAHVTETRPVVRSRPPEEVLALEKRASRSELPPLRSLTSYWRVDMRHRPDESESVVDRLNRLPEVGRAYRERVALDPAVNAANDPYATSQGYLDPAPAGIDARWAWTQPAGEGAGIGVVDLEQGWFLAHEDYASKSPTIIYGDNRDGVGTYVGNHGTAVLGEMIGDDNTVGVVGIAPSTSSVRVTSHFEAATSTALHVADAIVAAIPTMDPGDVLLLEVQRFYLPTETDDADFDAIRLASALGIIVVEAAGNGSNDLDAYTNTAGERILDRTHADFRDSGATLVGAAESDNTHDRAGFSNYGNRVDCYAWGEDVVTCGYGDLDDGGGDDDRSYTDTFSGTSSASPIISGAAILLQGMYESASGTRLSPLQMRGLLSDPATGTPQGPNVAGAIGVMPDLRSIVQTTLGLVPDIYVRDNPADTGEIPATGGISASPDVIVRPSAVADPNAAFGEGSGTENSSTLGSQVEAGQDNFVYVRLRNRGSSDATGVRCKVFWSEVSTLVTPDMWNLIGDTPPVDCPQGDTLVVTDGLTWPSASIPATGHYCMVALLDHPQDPAPALPPGPPNFDWNAFRDFIRNQNNVTWRNFNVVDTLPDPAADPVELPFLIAGAPDDSRRFDLEIIQRLPQGAQLYLELDLAVAGQIRDRERWGFEVDRERRVARLKVPSLPRVPLCGINLSKAARHRAAFHVPGAKQGRKKVDFGGNAVAIRQVYDRQEVGRVTWQFARPHKKTK